MDTAVEPVTTTASASAKAFQQKDKTPMGRSKPVDYNKVGEIKAHKVSLHDAEAGKLKFVLYSRDNPQMVEIFKSLPECAEAFEQIKALLLPKGGDLGDLQRYYDNLRPLWIVQWKYVRVDDADKKIAISVNLWDRVGGTAPKQESLIQEQKSEQPLVKKDFLGNPLPEKSELDQWFPREDENAVSDQPVTVPFIKDDAERKAFWAEANKIVSGNKEIAMMKPPQRHAVIHELLEVEHVEEFQGTREEAIKALKEAFDLEYGHTMGDLDPEPAPPTQPAQNGAGELAVRVAEVLNKAFPTASSEEKSRHFKQATGFAKVADSYAENGSAQTIALLNDHIKAELEKPFGASEQSTLKPPNNSSKPTAQVAPDTTTTALTTVPPQNVALSPEFAQWEVMRQQAIVLIKSGFLPATIKSPEQAIAIMMMGEAIGVKSIVALNTINVIGGKPTVSPQLMLAKARQSGQLEDFSAIDDGETCTVRIKRKGETEHVETFSQADAAAMGLAGKDNWKKQPATMRKWRAVAAACRLIFPDVLWGIASYTPEEINPDQMVNDAGEIVIEAA